MLTALTYLVAFGAGLLVGWLAYHYHRASRCAQVRKEVRRRLGLAQQEPGWLQ